MDKENVLVYRESLQGIADAIRLKTGGTEKYKPAEMAEAIKKLLIEDGTKSYESLAELQTIVGNEGDIALVAANGVYKGTYQYLSGNWTEVFSARRYDDTLTPEDYNSAETLAQQIKGGN